MNPLARLALHIAELLEQIAEMQRAIVERDERIAQLEAAAREARP